MQSCFSPFRSYDGKPCIYRECYDGNLSALLSAEVSDELMFKCVTKGPCCFQSWGALQLCLVGHSTQHEHLMHVVLTRALRTIAWGVDIPPPLQNIDFSCVLDTLQQQHAKWKWWDDHDNDNRVTQVREWLRVNNHIIVNRVIPWNIQCCIWEGRQQPHCVWFNTPKEIIRIILTYAASEVITIIKSKNKPENKKSIKK